MSSINSQLPPGGNHSSQDAVPDSERAFTEFRRKVRNSELLSAAIEKLLRSLRYTGKLTVIVQNGTILKTGYEEGYFRHQGDLPI